MLRTTVSIVWRAPWMSPLMPFASATLVALEP